MLNLSNYIGIPHTYGVIDCITLVKLFYEQELGIDLVLPYYTPSKKWMLDFTTSSFDSTAEKYGAKVPLTQAKNYDLLVFKSRKSNLLIHFGIYIIPNKMLHIEEGTVSRVDTLSTYWIENLHAVYRHEQLVR